MIDPEHSDLVGIDETTFPSASGTPPTDGQGRGHGKMLIIGAVELGGGNIPGCLGLAEMSSYGARDLSPVVETTVFAKTRRLVRLRRIPADHREVHIVGKTVAHFIFPCTHQAFSNLRGWTRGVCYRLHRKYLHACLGEFAFRFNQPKTAMPLSDRPSPSLSKQSPLPTSC